MVPATHSSTPYHEGEDSDAQRPPPDKAENHQRDPGRFSELIDPCCNRHGGASRMNVNTFTSRPRTVKGVHRSGTTARSSCPQTIVRWRQYLWPQVVRDRASRPALRPPAVLRVISATRAVPRRRGRTARQCRVRSTKCEERPSRLGAETAAALAHTGSQMRHAERQMPAPRLHAIRH